MVNAERILLSASREHRVMAEEGSNAVGEGSQPSQAGAESGASRKRESRGADASKRNEAEPSVGGDSYGTPRGVGHAELSEPDHAAGGGESESRDKQLDDSRGTEHYGIPSQQWQEDPASWESGYSELCITCDNRTDELRLLGNGVVPATAELAFRTLWEELM